jgi:hypothetical protein
MAGKELQYGLPFADARATTTTINISRLVNPLYSDMKHYANYDKFISSLSI